jgi:hypothetical protein
MKALSRALGSAGVEVGLQFDIPNFSSRLRGGGGGLLGDGNLSAWPITFPVESQKSRWRQNTNLEFA